MIARHSVHKNASSVSFDLNKGDFLSENLYCRTGLISVKLAAGNIFFVIAHLK